MRFRMFVGILDIFIENSPSYDEMESDVSGLFRIVLVVGIRRWWICDVVYG